MKYIFLFILLLYIFLLPTYIVNANGFDDVVRPSTAENCPKGVCLPNPLGDIDSPQKFIGQIINGVLGIVGSLALALFIYGGVIWMTAAGNAEQVTKGKNVLVWATLGLVIIFSSYALVRFVLYDLVGASEEVEQAEAVKE